MRIESLGGAEIQVCQLLMGFLDGELSGPHRPFQDLQKHAP